MRLDPDVWVVGGGPAGLAAAIALRSEGFTVSLADCAVPPIDKACGEGLMPDTVAALHELGVTIPSGTGFRFRGIRFADGSSSVSGDFSNGPGIGLRRTALHELLVERAKEVGVSLLWGVKGTRLIDAGLAIASEVAAPRLIVGADGLNSRIREAAGLDEVRREVRRFGFRRHYRIAPWSPYVEVHWGQGCQIYITPISEDEIGVALLSRNPKLRLDEALLEFPEITERLTRAVPCSIERGAVTVSRTFARPCGPGVALVGDASGSVDAIAGEGMGLSFRQSVILAQAFKAGNLLRYQGFHERLSQRPRLMEALLLSLARHRGLRRRVLASLARHPATFTHLLGIHVGESPLAELCSWRVLNLGFTIFAAE